MLPFPQRQRFLVQLPSLESNLVAERIKSKANTKAFLRHSIAPISEDHV